MQNTKEYGIRGKIIGTAAAAAAAGLLAARSEYEKKHFQIVTYTVKTDRLSGDWNDCRMVFLSDLHDNCFGSDNEMLIEAIEEINPCAVLIGGDMVVTKPWKKQDFSGLESLLLRLGKQYPVFYANGNHESRMKREQDTYPGWYEAFLAVLRRTKTQYLSDAMVCIRQDQSELYLYGLDLDEQYYRKGNKKRPSKAYLNSKLKEANKEGFCLLMAHSPLYLKEYAEWGADLVLAGHFHGGTIRLPFLGGVMSPQLQFFSKYNGDMVTEQGVPMIISAGLGTHSVNIRLNNPAQLVVMHFKTEDSGLQK